MVIPYVIVFWPKCDERKFVHGRFLDIRAGSPCFYVGSTGKALEDRFNEVVERRPDMRDGSPELLPEFSNLYGPADEAIGRASEGHLADVFHRLGYPVISDRSFSSPKSWGANGLVVSAKSVADAWYSNRFLISDDELRHIQKNQACKTSDIEGLRRKITALGRSFGNMIPNGRFALNSDRQIIRRLAPPNGIDAGPIFVVGRSNDEIVTHGFDMYFEDGRKIELVGKPVSTTDEIQLEAISDDFFEHIEPELERLVIDIVARLMAGR